MTEQSVITVAYATDLDAYAWVGRVLTNFAIAEQAIGSLCVTLGLPVTNGPLTSLDDLRKRLVKSGERKCLTLEKRIARWSANRPFRHLLAHATVTFLYDAEKREVLITRQFERDAADVTPDRMWTEAERRELLGQAIADGRSIHDHVKGLLADDPRLAKLRAP